MTQNVGGMGLGSGESPLGYSHNNKDNTSENDENMSGTLHSLRTSRHHQGQAYVSSHGERLMTPLFFVSLHWIYPHGHSGV